MKAKEEENAFFGGMACPSWDSKKDFINDSKDEFSWLFRISILNNES